ncbi:MAG: NAD(P)H-hydrate epimerase [Acidobacteriota bacterium]
MEILDNDAMREADRISIEEAGVPSLSLMERAGAAVAAHALDLLAGHGGRVAVVCGKGNNGGDGLVVARLLHARGIDATAYLLAPVAELSRDALENHARAIAAGVPIVESSGDALRGQPLAGAALIVDALFGTGVTRALTPPWSDAARAMNEAGPPVLSVDLPSGLSGSSGEIPGETVRATRTVALHALKWCHVLSPAHACCGDVRVAAIGIVPEAIARTSQRTAVIESRDAIAAFPQRPASSHKVTFGRLLVIAGSRAMPGAALLALDGALMGGAGLVTLASVPFVQSVAAARSRRAAAPLPGSTDGSSTDPRSRPSWRGRARRPSSAQGSAETRRRATRASRS